VKIVCNSSVLIALDNAGILHVLKALFKEILVPKSVRKEVFGRKKLPAFVKCIEISEPITLKVLESNLEAGEGEAICLYEEMDADLLIIDDLEGRRVAERLGITITGTLGILLLAKREKIIDKVKPLLDEIVSHGFRVADELYREILIKADEA
jgi:predicted nucleic acid-binding protein